MDAIVKKCTKCGTQHTELTKWCRQCKDKKTEERTTYYANPENVIKRRQYASEWKKNNPDKVRTQRGTWRINRRNKHQLNAIPEVGQLVIELEKTLAANDADTLAVDFHRDDLKFIVEILKQIVTMTDTME